MAGASFKIEQAKAIPIVDVALSLGLQLKKIGVKVWAEKSSDDPKGHTSLTIFEKTNRWVQFSGKRDPARGDVIDLVTAIRGASFEDAIDFLQFHFPRHL